MSRAPSDPPIDPGAVGGICGAAASLFAVSSVFLGYWWFSTGAEPKPKHFVVVVLIVIAFASAGLSPWLATNRDRFGKARWAYLVGFAAFVAAAISAIAIDYLSK